MAESAEIGGWVIYQSGSSASLDDWLKKYRPSKTENSTYAWIAVKNAAAHAQRSKTEDEVGDNEALVRAKACSIADDIASKVAAIETDPNIPVRGNKKNGIISKKETREKEHALAAQRLANLAVESSVVCGKWLLYPKRENVDDVWEKIARAIVEEKGPLHKKVGTAKVSPPQGGGGGEDESHVICIYCEESWNRGQVGDVFRILVKDLGLVSSAYKADIYTIAGIDSKHPSKMRSTLYGKKDFMTEDEITAAFEARKKPVEEVVKKKAPGAAGGFVDGPDSDSDDDAKPAPAKKAKK